jgi:hypothetical protein
LTERYFGHHAFNNKEWRHSYAINSLPFEDAYTLSILDLNSIIKFDRAGSLIWVFGGEDTDFPGVSWSGQHQHQYFRKRLTNGNTLMIPEVTQDVPNQRAPASSAPS